MNGINELAAKFISIYRIPIEEKWSEYLTQDHMNYFEYMVHGGITDTPDFDIVNPETYRLDMNRGLSTYLSKYSTYFNCKNIEGKVVVDVGCGWGFLSFWFMLCGAKEVYAIGFPYQIQFIERLKKAAESRNILPAKNQLICIEKPLEKGNKDIGGLGSNFADLIAFVDVFEHIPDDIFDDALTATFNTLKPGGYLISSCHNTDNELVRKRIFDYWDRLEREGFSEHRGKLISQKFPGLNPADLEMLVGQTRGMMLKEFNQTLNEYPSKGASTTASTKNRPAIDLTYDYICENYISPNTVVKKMEDAGFKSTCYPALRHSRRFMPIWPFEKTLNKLLMQFNSLSQTVVFEGKKESRQF